MWWDEWLQRYLRAHKLQTENISCFGLVITWAQVSEGGPWFDLNNKIAYPVIIVIMLILL